MPGEAKVQAAANLLIVSNSQHSLTLISVAQVTIFFSSQQEKEYTHPYGSITGQVRPPLGLHIPLLYRYSEQRGKLSSL